MLTPEQVSALGGRSAAEAQETATRISDMLASMLASSVLSGDMVQAMADAGRVPSAVLALLAGGTFATRRTVRQDVEETLTQSTLNDMRALGLSSRGAVPSGVDAVASNVIQLAMRDNVSMAEDCRRTYVNIVGRYVQRVGSGLIDHEEAVERSVRDLTDRGVCVVDYKSGIRTPIDVAMRRHVYTQVNQSANARTLEAAERLGCGLVETTSHTGARASHRPWQGRVFAVHGPLTVDGTTYPDLAASTGYGDVAGLCGANCRHSFAPWQPGDGQRWSDTPDEDAGLDPDEAERATKQQRANERAIRRAKQEASAQRASGGDDTRARIRLGRAQCRQRELLEENEWLKRRPERERLLGATSQPTALKNTTTSGIRMTADEARRYVASPEQKRTVLRQKQMQHIPGTREWAERVGRLKDGEPSPSSLLVGIEEVQALVDRLHGTGEVHVSFGGGVSQIKETVKSDVGIIGTWVSDSGECSDTDMFTIHYSKRGVHVVPSRPSAGR